MFLIICGLIVYGSFFPFEFSTLLLEEALSIFYSSWKNPGSRGDILGNTALFIPYGLFGLLAFGYGSNKVRAALLLLTFGFILASACQIGQLFLLVRNPSIFDILWNILGILIGLSLSSINFFHQDTLYSTISRSQQAMMALIILWFSSRLIPFIPSLDWQSIKDALKPLVVSLTFAWPEFVLLSVCWVVVAHFASVLLGYRWRPVYFPLAVTATCLLEILIVRNGISATELYAGVAAVVVWISIFERLESRVNWLAWLLLVAFMINGLFPFIFTKDPSPFHWLPFFGFLNGSMLLNAVSLCQKLFVFGSVLWLFRSAGYSNSFATISVLVAVLCVELAHIWSVGRTAELTDPLLVAACALVISRYWATVTRATPGPKQTRFDRTPKAYRPLRHSSKAFYGEVRDGRHKVLMSVVITGSIIASVIYLVVRLPHIPYNVRELFLLSGSWPVLFIFAIAVLWLGLGSAWMGRYISLSSRPALAIPISGFVVTTVLYVLLRLSTTKESISDIVGSSVFIHRVGVRGVLGDGGKSLVEFFGADNLRVLTDIVEPVIRLGALVGPYFLFSGILFTVLFRLRKNSESAPTIVHVEHIRSTIVYLLYAAPWFVLCKVLAFDWSSTDNLNELIARDGAFGLGGGGYLYALVALVASLAVTWSWFLVSNRKHLVPLTLLTLISLPIGWILLDAGLEQHVSKYGLTFSGVDFLLGPDRKHQLPHLDLFGRWLVLQLGAVIVIAGGANFFLRWESSKNNADTEVAEIESRGGHNTDIEVLLHDHQAEFIKDLSHAIGKTISVTVESIVSDVMQETAKDSKTAVMVHGVLTTDKMNSPGAAEMGFHVFSLSSNAIAAITRISKEHKISESRVIRRLVDYFMMSCRED